MPSTRCSAATCEASNDIWQVCQEQLPQVSSCRKEVHIWRLACNTALTKYNIHVSGVIGQLLITILSSSVHYVSFVKKLVVTSTSQTEVARVGGKL